MQCNNKILLNFEIYSSLFFIYSGSKINSDMMASMLLYSLGDKNTKIQVAAVFVADVTSACLCFLKSIALFSYLGMVPVHSSFNLAVCQATQYNQN